MSSLGRSRGNVFEGGDAVNDESAICDDDVVEYLDAKQFVTLDEDAINGQIFRAWRAVSTWVVVGGNDRGRRARTDGGAEDLAGAHLRLVHVSPIRRLDAQHAIASIEIHHPRWGQE